MSRPDKAHTQKKTLPMPIVAPYTVLESQGGDTQK